MGLSIRDIFEWMLRRPLQVIFATAAITVIFGWQMPNLSFKTSIYDLQIEDLPETTRYNDFKQLFGSDEIIRVVVKSSDTFDPVTFHKIAQIAEACAAIDGVRRVIGLPGIKKAVDVAGNWSMEKFYGVVSGAELFRGNLISNDRRTTALTLVLQNDADSATVILRTNQVLAQASQDLRLYQIGMPLVSEALARFTKKDFFRLPPVTFLIIAMILFYLFRKLRYILIPLGCVGLALVWTLGLMAMLKIPLSMLTMIVPVFLVAVGTAYCLHIVSEYLVGLQAADSPIDAIRHTFTNVALPTTLAVLTTVIGLGSLLANRITVIQEFAIFSCFGMISILVILLTSLPAALSLLPLPAERTRQGMGNTNLFSRFIDTIVAVNLKHQKIVLPAIGAGVLLCLIGIFSYQG